MMPCQHRQRITNISIMTSVLYPILAAVLYVCAAGLLWRGLSAGKPLLGGARTGVLVLAAGALALHAALLYSDLFQGGLNLGLTSAASLVAWAVTLLFLAAVLFQPIESLGVLILPVAAATLLLEWLWPMRHLTLPGASPVQAAHIVISLLAYSLLSIAVVQSLVLSLQERALHRRQAGGFLRNLPPLETMEHLLFRMIAVGFILLTLTLVSGVFFSDELFGKPLRFTHHIVLSIIAWAVFGMLLVGRRLYGWRGRTAVRWTLAGFTLLVLGYFGSKFVLEVLLGRAS
jgi:ABC-type uncharacterized transport system permease subunit